MTRKHRTRTPTATVTPTPVAAPTPAPVPATPVAPPTGLVIPTGYSAIHPDLSGDAADAIEACWNGASSAQCLVLPASTVELSRHLNLMYKSHVAIAGYGMDVSVLVSKNPLDGAVTMAALSDVIVQDFQVYSPNTTPDPNHTAAGRADVNIARGIDVTNCDLMTLQRVKVRNTAAAGIAFVNVTTSRIQDSQAQDTRADSFHVTGNSSQIVLADNTARGAGDDSFSVIGYGGERPKTILLLDNESYDGWWGSGVGIEGATNVTVDGNKVYRSGAAGIRIASNDGYFTPYSDNIYVSNNYLEGCVTRPELIDAHGSIMVYSTLDYIHGLTFTGNTIKDPAGHMGMFLYGHDATHDVQASATNNAMLDATGNLRTPFVVGGYAVLNRSGNSLNGVGI